VQSIIGFQPVFAVRERTPDRQDAYATLLTPPSSEAGAQSTIGIQPVFAARDQRACQPL
jgi:hypothetical protein